MKRLRPFFGYFGSKWRLATKYPVPKHKQIIEPFAGSAQYALLHHEKKVMLSDADFKICLVWQYLIETPKKDILALPDLKPGQSVDDLDIPEAAKFLIGFWLGSGLAQPNKTMTSWMLNPKYQPKCQWWGKGVRERIAEQQKYIRHWEVIHGSYCSFLDHTATWFVDPPYQIAGKHYKYSSKQINFEHLAVWCNNRTGQVIVCENEGANWLPFRPLASTKGTTKTSKEVVWTK